MAQIPPIDDAYINEIIKSNGPYNPALLTTQGLKMRELIKWLRDRLEQGDTEAVHKTGDESISGTKTFTFIKAEGLSVNNLANPSLDTVISPVTGVQTKLLNISEGAFEVQLSSSVLAASRSQLLQDKDGIIALTSDLAAFPTLSQFDAGLASKIDITEKGVPGGVSTLDSGGKILASQLPDSISGALTYQGVWDATSNTPALADPPASSTKGYYYVTNVAGTQFGITVAVGDWILSNGTAWEKVDNTDAVTTVFGRLGNVLANEADYSAFYPLLSGSYANPSWLTSLDYSKITGAPSGGVTTMVAIGSASNANSATISGSTLTLQPASASFGGVVTTGTQTFAGDKSFGSDLIVNGIKLGTGGGSLLDNTAVGRLTLNSNTTGNNNTAIGSTSLQNNTSGTQNTAVGNLALQFNLISSGSTAVGYGALQRTTVGDNTAVGRLTLNANTTGNNNTAIGSTSQDVNISGSNNTSVGFSTLTTNISGNDNTAIGSKALSLITHSNNTAVGSSAMMNSSTASNNVAVGSKALMTNTTGSGNTAIGTDALLVNNIGHSNTAIGHTTLRANTTGILNTAVGIGALAAATSDGNTAVGAAALSANTTGHSNNAFGSNTLTKNTTGVSNIAVGVHALRDNTIGHNNTAVGTNALFANITGNTLTAIGSAADVTTSALTNATAIGFNAKVDASNKIQLGSTSVTLVNTNGAYQGSQFKLSALNTAPLSATDTGTLGEIRVTADYIYVCTATNIWVRTVLATW